MTSIKTPMAFFMPTIQAPDLGSAAKKLEKKPTAMSKVPIPKAKAKRREAPINIFCDEAV